MEFITGDRYSKWLSELKNMGPSVGGTGSFSSKSKWEISQKLFLHSVVCSKVHLFGWLYDQNDMVPFPKMTSSVIQICYHL